MHAPSATDLFVRLHHLTTRPATRRTRWIPNSNPSAPDRGRSVLSAGKPSRRQSRQVDSDRRGDRRLLASAWPCGVPRRSPDVRLRSSLPRGSAQAYICIYISSLCLADCSGSVQVSGIFCSALLLLSGHAFSPLRPNGFIFLTYHRPHFFFFFLIYDLTR